MARVQMASPYGFLSHKVENRRSGEVVGWDDASGKPLVRFQLEETQVIVAVPIHWLTPIVSRWSVVDRDGLPIVR